MKKQLRITAWAVKPKLLFAAASLVLVCFSACKKDNKKAEPETPTTPTPPTDPEPVYGTVADAEGNTYKTVVIGTQTWTAENLRSTKLNDGTSISNLTDANAWASSTVAAYCYYNNADSSKTKYGALYNWLAASSEKLAPAGWHVATMSDYIKLISYLKAKWNVNTGTIDTTWGNGTWYKGGEYLKVKSWSSTNLTTNNKTGFSAISAGYRNNLQFSFADNNHGEALFWTATEFNSGYGRHFMLNGNNNDILGGIDYKYIGYYVRCVKD